MMWLSVDPMSDERPLISPYNYCQWNPIGRVDTWGMLDEIVIRGMDGSKTTYVPGMSSEGCDEFTAQVIDNYNTAYNGSATAREDIDNLVNSKGTYQVEQYYKSGFSENVGGKGGTIYYNSNGQPVPVQKNENSLFSILDINPITGLMHETIHASRWEQGIDIRNTAECKGTSIEEIQTMHRENMFRGEMGYPLRTYYSIENSQGQQVGSGFPMLKFKGPETGIISNYSWKFNNHQIFKYSQK